MLNWLRSWFGRKGGAQAPARERATRATFDAAATTAENARHWTHTDALSARRANSLAVRKVLRERARYEVDNNSYAEGIVDSVANNLVGRGRRLRVTTADEAVNRQVEEAFDAWAKRVRLSAKLRTMARAKKVDGEAFGILVNNPALPGVQLDFRPLECDQVTDLWVDPLDPLAVDGLRFDEAGNVAEYHVLKYHPGDWFGSVMDVKRLPAADVVHWFKRRRPGQARGVPEITPALHLFAQHRRFTMATLSAAETAAMFAALLESQAPADQGESQVDPFEALEIERGMAVQLPAGMTAKQMTAEHPSTTYEMFEWCLIRQICRCLHLPLAIALGDSSKSNFASARLDHLLYWEAVDTEREDCERDVLEPVFAAWYAEARLVPGLLPEGLPARAGDLPHAWSWPARPVIDPIAEAQSDEVRLRSGTTTQAELAGGRGEDWRDRIRQQAKEEAYRTAVRKEMGLPPAAAPAPAPGGGLSDAA